MFNNPCEQTQELPLPEEKSEVIGGPYSFWHYSTATGYDMTHPNSFTALKTYPRMTCKSDSAYLTLDPSKTALVILDMQNYFLSPALHRPPNSAGLQAAEKLRSVVIPACRKKGIQIIWCGWGMKRMEVTAMPPTIKRSFLLDNNFVDDARMPGVGEEIGRVQLEDGSVIDGGKALVRNTWNAAIYDPLARLVDLADLKVYKNCPSGLAAGGGTERALRARNIRTLLFAGCNAEQSVTATIMEAACLNFDCILLRDATATSPAFMQEALEHSMEGLGFKMTCEDLANGEVQSGEVQPGEDVD